MSRLAPYGIPGQDYGAFTGKAAQAEFAATVSLTCSTTAALTTAITLSASTPLTLATAAALTTVSTLAASIPLTMTASGTMLRTGGVTQWMPYGLPGQQYGPFTGRIQQIQLAATVNAGILATGTLTTAITLAASQRLALNVGASIVAPGGVTPELPRVLLTTTYVPPSGATIPVPAGTNLQLAINAANPGDLLVVDATGTYLPVNLPTKGGSSFIYIVSSALVNLPEGVRVTPAQAGSMPKIISSDTTPAITCSGGAHHYRFVGFEIATTFAVTTSTNFNLIALEKTGGNATLADCPTDIVFDRCYIHGTPTGNCRRGILMNSARTAVVDSYVSEFHELGADSQAIASWNGPGPFKILNTYLEAACENILFGGVDPAIANLVPSDVEFRNNYCFKPLKWKLGDPAYAGLAWSVKNLLELKNVQRVLIDGNRLENNWIMAQDGFGVLFTVRNQDGAAPWSTVQDVTYTHNVLVHSSCGVNMQGFDNNFTSQHTDRILIQHNYFEDIAGRLFQMIDGPGSVVIDHNTAPDNLGNIMTAGSSNQANIFNANGFVFTNNIVNRLGANNFGFKGDGTNDGNPTLAVFFQGALFARNVIIGGDAVNYPADTLVPATVGAVGFVDLANFDLRLLGSSPYHNAGLDGLDIGAVALAINLDAAGPWALLAVFLAFDATPTNLMAGAASLSATATATTLTTAIPLSASQPLRLTAAPASLTTSIRMAGSVTAGMTVAPAALSSGISLAGAATGRMTATGTLSTSITLAGAASTASSATAALQTSIRLAAAVSAAITTSASLLTTTGIALVGNATASAQAVGALQTSITMAASVTAGATASGFLVVSVAEMAGAATGSMTASGTLQTSIRFAGSASAGLTTTALLIASPSGFAADVTGSLTAAGALTTGPIAFAGTASLTGTATGSLTAVISLAGTSTGSMTATGTLTTSLELAATVPLTLSPTAALLTAINLAAVRPLTLTAAGDMRVPAEFAAGRSCTMTAVGSLSTRIEFAAQRALALDATGSLTTAIRMAASTVLRMTAEALSLDLVLGEATLFGVPPRRRIFPFREQSPVGVVIKRPNESFLIGIDFASILEGDEALVQGTPLARDQFGVASTGTVLSGPVGLSTSVALIRCHAGNSGSRHIVELRVLTSLGNSYEGEIQLSVESAAHRVGAISKQPSESIPIGPDFTRWLDPGETLLDSVPIKSVDARNDATQVTSTAEIVAGSGLVTSGQFVVRCRNGTSGDRHIVQYRIPTSASNVYEAEVAVSIEET